MEALIEVFENTRYFKRKGSNRVVMCNGCDEHGDYILGSLFEYETSNWKVKDFKLLEEYNEVTDFDPSTIKRQTCGRRIGEYGPWSKDENLDYWEDHDGADSCSFCGSAKFELFLEVIKAVNEDKEGYNLEKASGKMYKYYLGTPGNNHIKFYTPHIPKYLFERGHDEEFEQFKTDLQSALRKSHTKFMERFNQK